MAEEKTQAKKKKSRKKHRKLPIVIGVIVVVFIGFRVVGAMGSAQPGAYVTTTGAVRGDLQESIDTSGTVLSEEVKVIFAPVSGTLAEVNVEAGSAVKAGEQLISYDMDKMEKVLRQSALQLEKSEAGYDDALERDSQNQADLKEATVNLEVLNRQIEDNKAYLKDLQDNLSQSQRETSNALAAESLRSEEHTSELQSH